MPNFGVNGYGLTSGPGFGHDKINNREFKTLRECINGKTKFGFYENGISDYIQTIINLQIIPIFPKKNIIETIINRWKDAKEKNYRFIVIIEYRNNIFVITERSIFNSMNEDSAILQTNYWDGKSVKPTSYRMDYVDEFTLLYYEANPVIPYRAPVDAAPVDATNQGHTNTRWFPNLFGAGRTRRHRRRRASSQRRRKRRIR